MAIAAVALLGLAVAGALVWRDRRGPARPNVLLVTIDTLRADRLGCYGARDATTPVLDALAGRGVRFETAVAAVPLTGPSHATILSGLTPVHHGVRDNGAYVLPDSVPTLAEAFRAAGYRTAGFVSGFPVDRRFGFARGFDHYDDRLPHSDELGWGEYVERRADRTTAVVREWLEGRRGEPWFAWVHYFDPHGPYDPPPAWASRFPGRPYDGEVAFVDEQLGVLLRALEQSGPLARTLVLVTGDHGESLGEHGEDTHGVFVYDSTLLVPLILAGPGVPAGHESRVVARLVDVTPTLLDLAGLRPLGVSDGRSLRPALGGRAMPDEPAYVESLYVQHQLGRAPLHGLRTAAWKLVDAPRPELYALREDPGETRDRTRDEPGRVEGLRRGLQALLSAPTPDARSEVDPEVRERLAALGYLGGAPAGRAGTAAAAGSVPAAGRASGRDPKDGIGLINRLGRGVSLARTRPEEAVRELSAVLAEDPGMLLARRFRAMALAGAGRHAAAVDDLRAIEAAGLLSGDDLVVMGSSLRALGRRTEAAAALERASTLLPRSPLPWLARGNALLEEGRVADARAAFEHVLALVPDHLEALRGAGDAAFVGGDLAEAGRRYGRILEVQPGDVRALVKMGVVDVRSGRGEEGLARFRRAVEQAPQDAEALLYLAGALSSAGRLQEAIPYFERSLAASPRSVMALNGLGLARLQLGDARRAAAALGESLALDPRQPEVAKALADLRATGGR